MKLSGSVGVGEVTQSGSGKGGGEARVLGACRPPCANSEQRVREAECKNTQHQGRGENAMATAEEGPWIWPALEPNSSSSNRFPQWPRA
jgi:hypothetical protein